ncbi:MAG TPA: error-prone DNA polymerase [Verrucomicrobiales bacterium]|nr:error-prone DNA polymerase [Verrucomicrobiales bacterium]
MPAGRYIELHARSAFSFLRGASGPERLMERAAELALPSVAVCDRDGVYGSPRAFQTGKEHGVRAIVGAELTLEDGTVLPVLVRNRAGYQNLSRLLTRAKLRAAKNESRIAWEEFREFGGGLVALTGDEESAVPQAIMRDEPAAAEQHVLRLVDFFGPENVFVEVQRHRRRGEERLVRALADLAEHLKLRLLATNGVQHATPEGRELLDAFTCLRHHTHLDAAGDILSVNAERHLKSAAEMQRLFADLPEAVTNTVRLADELEFTLQNLGYRFPDFPVAPGDTMAEKLRRETYAGARWRFGRGPDAKLRAQLEHELALIHKLGFDGYFLIVWDMVRFCREQGILCQGRGSAANSAVCFCLGITAVNPLEHKLLFERFLSEGSTSWPDIDLDLPSGDRRESVIQEVYRRHAPNGAAMTANVITYRGRSAMREMGKVLNLPPDVLGRFSDLNHHGDFPDTQEFHDKVSQAGLPEEHPRLPALTRLYQAVYGLPRHLGQHSGGMVICNHGLDAVVPLEPAAMPGRVVVQWDKDDCEDLGIIKIDFLGLGMMAAMQDCLELCRARGPEREFDLAKIPKDDPATYELMNRADTVGVFQIESRAQMSMLPRLQPRRFYDLVIEVAIVRPGPIQGGMVHPYLKRRSGEEPVDYPSDEVKQALERTLGVPIFQEQVMQLAILAADFTPGEADRLRRAMAAWKRKGGLGPFHERLVGRMVAKGYQPEYAERIFKQIEGFGEYGFPESHAASFALLVYVSAWLKCHHPDAFLAALLNSQPMGFYAPAQLVRDAREHGVTVRPVDVSCSEWDSTLEGQGSGLRPVRLGLSRIAGLQQEAAMRIVAARAEAPFASAEDLARRARLDAHQLQLLAGADALVKLSGHRHQAAWAVAGVDTRATPMLSDTRTHEDPVELAAPNAVAQTVADYRATGLTLGAHPVGLLREQLAHFKVQPAAVLKAYPNGRLARASGLVTHRQRPETAKGVVFVTLEDETGSVNVIVWPQVVEQQRRALLASTLLTVYGIWQCEGEVRHLIARKLIDHTPLLQGLDARSRNFR